MRRAHPGPSGDDAGDPDDAERTGEHPAALAPIGVELLSPHDEPRFPPIDAIALAAFPDGNFSAGEELSRPWARLWVASWDGSAAGFLVAWHVADELHVLNVATAAAVRRRGVGTALVGEALAYAATHRVRIALLEVRRSNRSAIRLYRSFGFTAMSVRAGYYSDNQEDAVEMILALDPATGLILPGRDEIRIDG